MIKEVSLDQGQSGVPVTHSRESVKKAAGYRGKFGLEILIWGLSTVYDGTDEILKESTA